MIAGVDGMNFENMPERALGHGATRSALLTMAVIDVYLFYRLRKAGWL